MATYHYYSFRRSNHSFSSFTYFLTFDVPNETPLRFVATEFVFEDSRSWNTTCEVGALRTLLSGTVSFGIDLICGIGFRYEALVVCAVGLVDYFRMFSDVAFVDGVGVPEYD